MNIEIRKSFEKDVDNVPASVQKRIAQIINQISKAKKISEIRSCKKLAGYKTAFRVRFGSYRIGFFFEKDTIELVRVLQRKDIYRFFSLRYFRLEQ